MKSGETYLSPSGGFSSSHFTDHYLYTIAIDPTNSNVWVGAESTVEQISTAGELASGSPFLSSSANADFEGAYSLSVDGQEHVWIASGSTVFELGSTGGLTSPTSGWTVPGNFPEPQAVAIDGSENVWIVDYYNNTLIEMTQTGHATLISPSLGQSMSSPDGVAVDDQGNIWIANYGTTYVASEYSQKLKDFISDEPHGFHLGNAQNGAADFVSMDGSGNAWFAVTDTTCTSTSSCVGTVELSTTGALLSGSTGFYAGGYTPGYPAFHTAAAIDGSGNEWVANSITDSVTELVGAAVPVVTPLAAAVANNTIATRP